MRFGAVLLLVAATDVGHHQARLRPGRLALFKEHRLPTSLPGLTQSAISGDARFCAARSINGVTIYSTATGMKVSELEGARDIHDGAFSFDGRLYCTAHNDGTVKVWDSAAGKELSNFHTGSGYSCAVCFTRDGRRIVADNGDRTGLILYDVQEKKELKRIAGTGSSYTYVSPDGRYCVASVGVVRVVDLKEERVVKEILPHSVVKIAMSPDSRSCAAGDPAGRVARWNLATGDEAASTKLDDGARVFWIEYSPDGRWIAASDSRRAIHILDARTLEVARKIEPEAEDPADGSCLVGFSRDGTSLVAVNSAGRVKIYRSR
jgi:WD40 repeat protein